MSTTIVEEQALGVWERAYFQNLEKLGFNDDRHEVSADLADKAALRFVEAARKRAAAMTESSSSKALVGDGHELPCYMSRRLGHPAVWGAVDWSRSDAELAEEIGCSSECVRRKRAAVRPVVEKEVEPIRAFFKAMSETTSDSDIGMIVTRGLFALPSTLHDCLVAYGWDQAPKASGSRGDCTPIWGLTEDGNTSVIIATKLSDVRGRARSATAIPSTIPVNVLICNATDDQRKAVDALRLRGTKVFDQDAYDVQADWCIG